MSLGLTQGVGLKNLWVLRFRVSDFGFRVHISRFKVQNFEVRFQGLGVRALDYGLWILDLGFRGWKYEIVPSQPTGQTASPAPRLRTPCTYTGRSRAFGSTV